jgi:hypothetical protein
MRLESTFLACQREKSFSRREVVFRTIGRQHACAVLVELFAMPVVQNVYIHAAPFGCI